MPSSPRFGYFLVPEATQPLIPLAMRAESLGLDYIGVQDHPYQRRYVDTWALLATIAAKTTTLKVFPDVANLPLRPPAVMAKAAGTIDLLSDGRFELGLGAGGFWDAIEAYGGPRRTPAESLAALEEGIEVIRQIWSGDRNRRFEGQYYRLAGAQAGPPPAHPIGIWLGAYGPRALDLTARVADGWVPSFRGDLTELVDKVHTFEDAAASHGRALQDFRRVLNVNGEVTDGSTDGRFRGPVSQWVEDIHELTSHGFDTFIFWGEGSDQLDRFAAEVVPAAKEQY